ncbi:MAG: outer membrane protein assembly factor BamD [Vicinamibacterales bacterium]
MTRRFPLLMGATLALAAALSCAKAPTSLPPGTAEADKFLYDRGQAAVAEEHWVDAREYFRNLVDNYPQSSYRPDAKLALGDTYLAQKGTENLLLAANEYREFQTFYPTHPRADYAQLQLARTYAAQMLAPERDQTATRDAIREVDIFLERYPNSKLMPEARELERNARDRLSEAGYQVGFFYYRASHYAGAIDRFKEVLAKDPQFSHRDAVTIRRVVATEPRRTRGAPYYERLLKEFEQSEYLEDAQKRVEELKSGNPAGK